MGVEPKIGVEISVSPQIIHLFIGFGTMIFIHFGGKINPSLFLGNNTHMLNFGSVVGQPRLQIVKTWHVAK